MNQTAPFPFSAFKAALILKALLLVLVLAGTAPADPIPNTLPQDPFLRQNLHRSSFEPGGKYHLFRSRGTVGDRTGQIGIMPGQALRMGNLEIEQAFVRGNIGYKTHFRNHTWEEHAPFDNHAQSKATADEGSITNGFTVYRINYTGKEHHPKTAYDGEQGGNHPPPDQDPRDEYRYTVSGEARRIGLNLNDDRSFAQRMGDRFTGFSEHSRQAHTQIFDHDSRLNRAGNTAQAVNGFVSGAQNGFTSIGDILGVSDAVQGAGALIDGGTMVGISAMSAEGKMNAIGRLGGLGDAGDYAKARTAEWARNNPNTAEFAKLGANAAAGYYGARGMVAGSMGKSAATARNAARSGTEKAAAANPAAHNAQSTAHTGSSQTAKAAAAAKAAPNSKAAPAPATGGHTSTAPPLPRGGVSHNFSDAAYARYGHTQQKQPSATQYERVPAYAQMGGGTAGGRNSVPHTAGGSRSQTVGDTAHPQSRETQAAQKRERKQERAQDRTDERQRKVREEAEALRRIGQNQKNTTDLSGKKSETVLEQHVAKRTAYQDERINQLIRESQSGDKTKGRTIQYVKNDAGYAEAKSDFDSLKLTDVIVRSNGTITGKLMDGRIVNFHPNSSDGRPTLEIPNKGKSGQIKIRYGMK